MSKMGLHDPFGYLKHKLCPKEGQFDSQSLKVENRPDLLAWRWHVTYHWNFFEKCYNFASKFISIKGLHTKLWASKVARVPISRILGLPLGSPGTKWHLGVGLVIKHRQYYKGEGDGFPQVWAMVSLVSLCLHVVRSCTKSVQIMH